MDEGRPLTDAALDRELSEALGVEPSPDFLARVRQRVAGEPAPMPWWGRRVTVTAAGVLLVAAAVWNWSEDERTAVRSAPGPEVVATEARPARTTPASEVSATPAEIPVREPRPVPTRIEPDANPAPTVVRDTWEERFSVVLLAENERQAIQWLGAATRVPPPRPAEITHSTERSPGEEPDLAAINFESPEMAGPVFELLRLE